MVIILLCGICEQCCAGRLRTAALVWRAEAGIVVVMVVRRDVIGTITGMIYVISQ